MPEGSAWLTMHIMKGRVRIHLVILMITFTFNLIGKHESETSAAYIHRIYASFPPHAIKPKAPHFTVITTYMFLPSATERRLIVHLHILKKETLTNLMTRGGIYHPPRPL